MRLYEPRWFEPWEFVPPAVLEAHGETRALMVMDYRMLKTADALRAHFGVPVTVNNYKWGGKNKYRGFRPANCTVGAQWSQHKYGRALDCTIHGITAQEARTEIVREAQHFPYITRMEDEVDWLHVDCMAVVGSGIWLFKP